MPSTKCTDGDLDLIPRRATAVVLPLLLLRRGWVACREQIFTVHRSVCSRLSISFLINTVIFTYFSEMHSVPFNMGHCAYVNVRRKPRSSKLASFLGPRRFTVLHATLSLPGVPRTLATLFYLSNKCHLIFHSSSAAICSSLCPSAHQDFLWAATLFHC